MACALLEGARKKRGRSYGEGREGRKDRKREGGERAAPECGFRGGVEENELVEVPPVASVSGFWNSILPRGR